MLATHQQLCYVVSQRVARFPHAAAAVCRAASRRLAAPPRAVLRLRSRRRHRRANAAAALRRGPWPRKRRRHTERGRGMRGRGAPGGAAGGGTRLAFAALTSPFPSPLPAPRASPRRRHARASAAVQRRGGRSAFLPCGDGGCDLRPLRGAARRGRSALGLAGERAGDGGRAAAAAAGAGHRRVRFPSLPSSLRCERTPRDALPGARGASARVAPPCSADAAVRASRAQT